MILTRLYTFYAWYRLLRRLRPHTSVTRAAWRASRA